MKILGIETTCDETAVAVVENGHTILFHLIASQAKEHARWQLLASRTAGSEKPHFIGGKMTLG